MGAGRRRKLIALTLAISSPSLLGACGESSRGANGESARGVNGGSASAGAPSVGGAGGPGAGTTSSGGASATPGGSAGVGGNPGTSGGSPDAGRSAAGDTATSGAGMSSSDASGAPSGGGAGWGGKPSAGAGGTTAGNGGAGGTTSGSGGIAAGAGGTAGAPEFSCPELGDCSITCVGSDPCLRTCHLDIDASMIGTDEAVARLAALHCELVESPLLVFGGVTSLTGLESIRQITSQVSIDEVPELADLSGLSGLENVSGRVLIDAVHMKTVELPALKEVDSYVLIQALGSVERIALPSLTIVKDYVDINNTSATEIELGALERVSGKVRIFNNPSLLTLHELPALLSATELDIEGNSRLPQCEVDAIASRLNLACSACTNNGSGGCP